PQSRSSIIMLFRTGHIPLHGYLHRIGKRDDPDCPHCPGVREDVRHFLFDCPNYQLAHHSLWKTLLRAATNL
ncbi:hypothetical protein GLOTRDRAFT_8189, partial [Gloeophyllum trabeum ATCC 11539]